MPTQLIFVGLCCLWMLLPKIAWSQDENIDQRLAEIQKRFQLEPLPYLPDRKHEPLFMLGNALFFEQEISGNRNISCGSCHQPNLGTSDGLPLSMGQGNRFFETAKPLRSDGALLRRSAPVLYNLGHSTSLGMFWDSRVSYDAALKQFTTPSIYLNGTNPSLSNVTAVLPNALAAQALFPMADRNEMRGMPGENEIADTQDEEGAWQAIVSRILNLERYRELLTKAYPDIRSPSEFNIGHLGKAIAYYIEAAFSTPNTPYDAFLRGDHSRLSDQEKKGMVVFFSSGGCFRCHNGPLLTKEISVNIGIPVIEHAGQAKPDQGLYEITGVRGNKYQFKAPGLRNVALSAPYMHNGAFATLEDVVEHYSDPVKSIRDYVLHDGFGKQLGEASLHYDKKATFDVLRSLDARVSGGLTLSKEDKANLLAFLKNSLTSSP